MPDNFLVIRIHPDSPVDGATFSTYLEDLQIKVYLAGTYPGTAAHPAVLLGQTQVNAYTLNLVAVPWLSNTYVASVSKKVAAPTTGSGTNYGTTLQVTDGAGIAFGSLAICPADSSMFNSNTSVTVIPAASNPTTLTLSQNIHDFAAQDTLVTFYFAYGPSSVDSNAPSINPTWTGSDPSFQFDLKVKGAVSSSPTVNFDHSDGIAVGMTMTSATGVPAGTTVISVPNGTSITLNNNVTLANNATVTFQSSLNSGIMQHVEPVEASSIFGGIYVPIPASVATAIIPMTISIPAPPANSFLDVTVVATRGGVTIPVNNDFYDVIVSPGAAPTPDQYQSQPLQDTSLYLTLPPPPNTNAIDLTIPTDGTAPNFDDLYKAMTQALANDTNFPAGRLSTTCRWTIVLAWHTTSFGASRAMFCLRLPIHSNRCTRIRPTPEAAGGMEATIIWNRTGRNSKERSAVFMRSATPQPSASPSLWQPHRQHCFVSRPA